MIAAHVCTHIHTYVHSTITAPVPLCTHRLSCIPGIVYQVPTRKKEVILVDRINHRSVLRLNPCTEMSMTVRCVFFSICLRFSRRQPNPTLLFAIDRYHLPVLHHKRSASLGRLLRGDDIQPEPMDRSGSGESSRQQHLSILEVPVRGPRVISRPKNYYYCYYCCCTWCQAVFLILIFFGTNPGVKCTTGMQPFFFLLFLLIFFAVIISLPSSLAQLRSGVTKYVLLPLLPPTVRAMLLSREDFGPSFFVDSRLIELRLPTLLFLCALSSC